MEELQKNIDEVFRQSLGDYREAPPPAAWNQVVRRLDQEDKGRRRLFLGWPWIMLSLLIVMGCAWIVVGLSLRGRAEDKNLPTAATGMAVPAPWNEPIAHSIPLSDLPNDEDSRDILTKNNTESNQQDVPSKSHSKKHPLSRGRRNDTKSAVPIKPTTISTDKTFLFGHVSAASIPASVQQTPADTSLRSVSQPRTDALAVRHKERIKVLPAAHNIRLFTAKRPAAKAPELRIGNKADFPTLSVAKTLHEATQQSVSINDSKPSLKKNDNAALGPTTAPASQPAYVWQKPAARRIGKLAITKRKAALSHEKLQSPVTLQQALAPVTAAVAPASIELAEQQPTERLMAKAQNKQQSEPSITPAATAIGTIRVSYPDGLPVFTAAAEQPLPKAASSTSPNRSPANALGNVDTTAAAGSALEPLQQPRNAHGKRLFSFAVLGGFEQKMQSGGQATLSARLLWELGKNVSIGIQPTFRYSQLASTTVGKDAAYQRSAWRIDSFRTTDISPTIAGKTDEIYNYVIHQIYDSIVIRSRSIGGSFWEIELPVMVRFRLNNSWSVWGGPSLVFGGKLNYTGDGAPQVYFTERKDLVAQSVQKPKEEFLNYFGTSSLPEYSTYKPSEEPDQASPLRFGYMAGVGYNRNSWLLEASLHGQLSGYRRLAEPARDVYSHPNVRVSIGYLLFSTKKAAPAAP